MASSTSAVSCQPDELARLPAGFDDAIARSPQLLQLLRNCVAMGQWAAAAAIAERILAVNPASVEVRTLLSQAQSNAARAPVAGRNDPCPCGSGKRFKHCHGEINAGAGATNVQGGAIGGQSGGISLQDSAVGAQKRRDQRTSQRAGLAGCSFRARSAGTPKRRA
jgi:hypothetical protein